MKADKFHGILQISPPAPIKYYRYPKTLIDIVTGLTGTTSHHDGSCVTFIHSMAHSFLPNYMYTSKGPEVLAL